MLKQSLTQELFNLAHELEIRRSNAFHYSWTKYQDVSDDEILNRIILLAAKLKTSKTIDYELCCQDGHYSYCDNLYDLINDALYIESLSKD